jgi:hypothetical protein
MAQNETNQMPRTTDRGERVDIDENIGAQRRPDGSPDTDFDMESAATGEEGMESGPATVGGVRGAIHDRATTGALGSGPINIGTGTSGGTDSPNTSGTADITGQTTAGAGDSTRAGGATTDPMYPDRVANTPAPDYSDPSDEELSGESGIANHGAMERDEDRRQGVGNRQTYMSEDAKK